ncbi:MAG TPA: FecR family protein [Methylotenera sp.]|nr:FecR family protein [Methylotenera sp.]HPH07816.1 FecR family protein [Methylotenera sp.]HPM48849.1 FecR family protein [Methylotenera sp.]
MAIKLIKLRKNNFSAGATLGLLLVMTLPMLAVAEVGKVQFVTGNVTAIDVNGTTRALTKGADIQNGDMIQTADGRAQVRFIDGGYMSFQPNTEFKVEDYHFSGQADGSEKGFFKLVKGSLRAITGLIGKSNKQAWRMNSPVATIGIRGTETLSEFKDGVLRVTVGDGAAYLENSQGSLILYQGQTGETDGKQPPQYSAQEVKISAAAPRKAGVGSTEHQKDASTSVDEIDSYTKVAAIEKDRYFSVTDTKVDKNNGSDASDTSDDIIKAIPAVILVALDKNSSSLFEGGLANLPQLHTLRAKAEYSATTHISFLGGLVPSNANLTSTLKINFSNYKAEFDVQSDKFVGGLLDNRKISAEIKATLNSSTGAIPFTNAPLKTTGPGANGLLTVNSAQLDPTNLSLANMSYTLQEGVTGDSAIISNQTLVGNLTKKSNH